MVVSSIHEKATLHYVMYKTLTEIDIANEKLRNAVSDSTKDYWGQFVSTRQKTVSETEKKLGIKNGLIMAEKVEGAILLTEV